jgi:putative ABC transport system permease protein
MQLYENLKMAIQSIISNKMRSILTMLGIIIGISSVIALVSVGKGSQQSMKQEFENIGVNRVYLYVNYNDDIHENINLTMQDMTTIKRIFANEIEGLTPEMSLSCSINLEKKTENVKLNAASEDYQLVDKFKVVKGRFLTEDDVESAGYVAVISSDMAKEVFGSIDAVGKRIFLTSDSETLSYKVIGVYTKPKSRFMQERAFNAYVPFTNIMQVEGYDSFGSLEFNIKDGYDKENILDKMAKLMERRHDVVGKNAYDSYTPESEMKTMNKFMSMMTLFVSGIAGISLLVGGIGIMNIMLVSVTERTREIGIRKAIGANKLNIMTQFLIESIIISAIGGLIGMGIGYLIGGVLGSLIKVTPIVTYDTILLSCGFCAAIGIFFGLYPAKKAADLNPIDALRYE